MSQYTTGELAKACGVTVRTVQFYDQRGILIPSALTEGGRRLYSAEDLKKMKIICFLRETGLSLDTLKAAEGEHFFRHTYQYAPTKKDIEYKICVMYYFEP